MDRIGVRELRQYASRYLARVARGETLEITVRGRPVARLVPVTGDAWADLIAAGIVVPPEDEMDVTDEPPVDYGVNASEVLSAIRAGER